MTTWFFLPSRGFTKALFALGVLTLLSVSQGCSKFSSKAEGDKAKSGSGNQASSQLVSQAEQAAKNNEIDRAFELYDQAVKAGYPAVTAEIQKGKVLLGTGSYAKAAKRFDEALKIDPGNRDAAVFCGYALYMAGDFGPAENRLVDLVSKDPKQYYAKYLLGATYNKVGKPDLAAKEFQDVISQRGENQNILNNLGISYFMLGQYENARDSFLKSLKIGQSKRTQNNLALTLCRLKRYEEAFKLFKSSGGDAFAYNNVGCCYIDAGDNQKAMELFNKAINTSPTIYKPAHDNIIRYGSAQQETPSVRPDTITPPNGNPAPAADGGVRSETTKPPVRTPTNVGIPSSASQDKTPIPLTNP
ncbi:tetratricopeptide repeat protein [Fundidesulfovibrio terrae]|uniref:tetratricopeptide repeat protein n=1 Tax=Fundidesulfovibrio terrae TaxID=2922866 RepID=UPI001FAF5058|nr:tetratricopeptide repeat protein [Fundidesulfovibrio terrae]